MAKSEDRKRNTTQLLQSKRHKQQTEHSNVDMVELFRIVKKNLRNFQGTEAVYVWLFHTVKMCKKKGDGIELQKHVPITAIISLK